MVTRGDNAKTTPIGVSILKITYKSTANDPKPPGWKGKWPPPPQTTTLTIELVVLLPT